MRSKKQIFFFFWSETKKNLLEMWERFRQQFLYHSDGSPLTPEKDFPISFHTFFFFLFPNTRRIDNLIQDSALQGGGFTVPWGFLSHPLFPQTKLTTTVTSLKKSSSVLFLFLPHQRIIASMVCPKTQWI